MLKCISCGNGINIESILLQAKYSWNSTGSVWWECDKCQVGNHVNISNKYVGIIKITGAPGPTYEYLQRERCEFINCIHEIDGLNIYYDSKSFFIRYRGVE
jgi:hypothetical protein